MGVGYKSPNIVMQIEMNNSDDDCKPPAIVLKLQQLILYHYQIRK